MSSKFFRWKTPLTKKGKIEWEEMNAADFFTFLNSEESSGRYFIKFDNDICPEADIVFIEAPQDDGVDKGAVSSYTFSNVTGAHTISVTFKANGRILIGGVSITDALGADLSSGTIKSGYGIFTNVSSSYSGVTNAIMTMSYNFGQGNKTVASDFFIHRRI